LGHALVRRDDVMTFGNYAKPVFKGSYDPCVNSCAYGDSVGVYTAHCEGNYCEQFMDLPKIKNLTTIVVAEMEDGTTWSMQSVLDNAHCKPMVTMDTKDAWESPTEFSLDTKITKASEPTVQITITGSGSASPYVTVQKEDPS
jgi:hypothetical protein